MKYIIFCLLISSNAFAQEAKSDFVKQGTPAPYSGILLNAQAQAQMMAQKEFDKKKCDLDNEYNLLKMRSACDLETGKLKVDIDIATKKYDTILKLKDDEIKRVTQVAIKESQKNNNNMWWLGGGVILGIATSIAIFFAVK